MDFYDLKQFGGYFTNCHHQATHTYLQLPFTVPLIALSNSLMQSTPITELNHSPATHTSPQLLSPTSPALSQPYLLNPYTYPCQPTLYNSLGNCKCFCNKSNRGDRVGRSCTMCQGLVLSIRMGSSRCRLNPAS